MKEKQETRRRKNRSDWTHAVKGGRKESAGWRFLLYEEVRVLRLGINWSGGAKTGDGLALRALEGQSGSCSDWHVPRAYVLRHWLRARGYKQRQVAATGCMPAFIYAHKYLLLISNGGP